MLIQANNNGEEIQKKKKNAHSLTTDSVFC